MVDDYAAFTEESLPRGTSMTSSVDRPRKAFLRRFHDNVAANLDICDALAVPTPGHTMFKRSLTMMVVVLTTLLW